MLNDIMNLIVNSDIRILLVTILAVMPTYWWSVPASSTGKYHPKFSLGEGGLKRHSYVVVKFAYRIATAWGLDTRTIDLIVVAALIHDGLKQGEDAGHTVHEHPTLMAKLIRDTFPENADAEIIAHMVESHMGKWNTSKYSKVVLPVPADDLQKLISAADMIAATKEIDYDFEGKA